MGQHLLDNRLRYLELCIHRTSGCLPMRVAGWVPGGTGQMVETEKRMEEVRRNSDYLASGGVILKGSYERNDLVAERQYELNFAEEKEASMRMNVWERGWEGHVEEEGHHVQRNLSEELRQGRGSYTVDVARDASEELHCDNRRDNGIEIQIVVEEDTVGSNAVDTDDVEDDERDYEAVGCNDSLVPNVDKEQLEDHSVLPKQHAPHLLHQDTFPWVGEYASNAYLSLAEPGHQTDAVNERSKRSSVISDVWKL